MSEPTVVVVAPAAEPEPPPEPVIVPEPEPEPEPDAQDAVETAALLSLTERVTRLESQVSELTAAQVATDIAVVETAEAVEEIAAEETAPAEEPVEIPVPSAPEPEEPQRRRPGWGQR